MMHVIWQHYFETCYVGLFSRSFLLVEIVEIVDMEISLM